MDNPATQPAPEQPVQQENIATQTQTPQTPTPPSTPGKPSSALKIILVTILSLLIVSGLVFAAFRLGQRVQTTPTSEVLETPTPLPSMYEGIPIGEGTVSFARENGVTYLRYRGRIYSEQEGETLEPKEETAIDENTLTWYGLVEAPTGLTSDAEFNRLFSFRETANGTFVFVMRWGTATTQEFETFYFTGSEVQTLTLSTGEGYTVPKVGGVSTDGMYVSFDMFGCWNCGGHTPEVIVVNLTTGENTNIGRTSEFTWGANGNYTYKEYVTKECDPPAEGPVECFEDPASLPEKSGSI